MTRREIVSMFAVAGTIAVSGCSLFNMRVKYRFRMTVKATTPQGIGSGSSVYEVWAEKAPKLLPEEHARDWGVKGEALVIDIPSSTPVFALMKTSNSFHEDFAIMSMAALDKEFHNDVVASARRIAEMPIGFGSDVAAKDWPIFVSFSDTNDPRSVSLLLADKAKVQSVFVELVDEVPSTGIKKRLKWLGDPGLTLDPDGGPTTTPKLAQQIRQSLFWQGPVK